MERNLTNGSIWGNIVSYSLPYLFTYFLQTLYGMADLYIVGQFNDTAQITAVSVGSQVMHMLTVMIVGLAMGTTVSIARAVGAGEGRRTSAIVGSTITLFMVVALAAMALLLVCVNPIVTLMSTPEAAVAGTRQYLTICFVGIPFITAYNIISSIFRGLGDSKSQRTHCPCDDPAAQERSAVKNGGSAAAESCAAPDPPGGHSRCTAGWFYSDCVYCHYHHCQPAWSERCCSGGDRGKSDRNAVSGAFVHAFHGVGYIGPEHWRREA